MVNYSIDVNVTTATFHMSEKIEAENWAINFVNCAQWIQLFSLPACCFWDKKKS